MIIDKKRKPKKPCYLCALVVLMAPAVVFAQASEGDLIGLGMSSELAEAIAKGISADGSYTLQADEDAQRKLVFDATSDTALTLKWGDGGTTDAQVLSITATTADEDDDTTLRLGGGGGTDQSRGAYAVLVGAQGSGSATLSSADTAGADVNLNAKDDVIIATDGGVAAWTFDTAAGSFIGAGTGTIGWTVTSILANTACSSRCTTPAVLGFGLTTDSAFPITGFVDGSSATADICLCAGAS